jgi:hypothetical protein
MSTSEEEGRAAPAPLDLGAIQQEQWKKDGIDVTEWHHWAFEWTAGGLKVWVDGVEVFSKSGGARSVGDSRRKNIHHAGREDGDRLGPLLRRALTPFAPHRWTPYAISPSMWPSGK